MKKANPSRNTSRILDQHFGLIRDELLHYSMRSGLGSHGDIIGSAREAFIQLFLRRNMPSAIDFGTGQIIDSQDQRSGQLDLVLRSSFAPTISLVGPLNLFLVDSVIAVMEIKSCLSTAKNAGGELGKALDTIRAVKALHRENCIRATVTYKTGTKIHQFDRTPCFLVAYHGPMLETLKKKIVEYGQVHGLSPEEYVPEVIIVIDRDYSVVFDNGWLYPKGTTSFIVNETNSCICDLFAYLCTVVQAANMTPWTAGFRNYLKPLEDRDHDA